MLLGGHLRPGNDAIDGGMIFRRGQPSDDDLMARAQVGEYQGLQTL